LNRRYHEIFNNYPFFRAFLYRAKEKVNRVR
jgi:hypothetical protein